MIDSPIEWLASVFDRFEIGLIRDRVCECGRPLIIKATTTTICADCADRRARAADDGAHPCADCPTIVCRKAKRCEPCQVTRRQRYFRERVLRRNPTAEERGRRPRRRRAA